jgi:hypothetical protein
VFPENKLSNEKVGKMKGTTEHESTRLTVTAAVPEVPVLSVSHPPPCPAHEATGTGRVASSPEPSRNDEMLLGSAQEVPPQPSTSECGTSFVGFLSASNMIQVLKDVEDSFMNFRQKI